MEKSPLARILGPIQIAAIQGYAMIQRSPKAKTVTTLVIATAVAVTSLANTTFSKKHIDLMVNGHKQTVATHANTLSELLKERSIELAKGDFVSVSPATGLTEGQTIIIRKPVAIRFQLGNQIQTVRTTAADVKGFMTALGIKATGKHAVTPNVNTALKENMLVSFNDVKTVVVEEKKQLPFETITKQDNRLLKGRQKVLQSGHAGLVVTKIEKQYQNGKLISVKEVSSTQTQKAQSRILAVGTARRVAILSADETAQSVNLANGVDFQAKRVLKNVTLTAYDAGFESTGKTKGQSGYGRTATGTTVTQGRTIAVDPSVIPLGWWVYIDGIGYRRAEDTGSAINGNKIDVYFDSNRAANAFGLKHGYTVYVIGPEKP
jgi:uncharacterized protein YabE (DUF348 family)/3D (Asp-Asp-Asp) domain-containing protein